MSEPVTVEYDYVTYTLDDNGTASVTDAAQDISYAIYVYPAFEYDGISYEVTSIANNAFAACSALPSITIPASITSIGNDVFTNCTMLNTIDFENAEGLTNIGTNLFTGTANIQYALFKITNLTLDNNIVALQTQISAVSNSVDYIYIYTLHGISYRTANNQASISEINTSLLTSDSNILGTFTIVYEDEGTTTTYTVITINANVKAVHTDLTDSAIAEEPSFFSTRVLDFRYDSVRALEFYTSEFEVTLNASKATLYDVITTPNVNRQVSARIAYDDIKNAFQYQERDGMDPIFRLVTSGEDDYLGFSTTDAVVTRNATSGERVNFGVDWLHVLAKFLFNNWASSNLFLNRTVASNLDPAFLHALKSNLDAEEAKTDDSLVVKKIYNNILYYDADRLIDAKRVQATESTEDNIWYIVPLRKDDIISFKVSVDPHDDQGSPANSSDTLSTTAYLFNFSIVY